MNRGLVEKLKSNVVVKSVGLAHCNGQLMLNRLISAAPGLTGENCHKVRSAWDKLVILSIYLNINEDVRNVTSPFFDPRWPPRD